MESLASELAGQIARNRIVRVASFVAFWLGIVVDGMRSFQLATLPFIAVGFCMALSDFLVISQWTLQRLYIEVVHRGVFFFHFTRRIFIIAAFIWQAF